MLSQTRAFCASFAVLLAIIASVLQIYDRGAEKTELLLGVCVLSARDHEEQRTAIRSTWFHADSHQGSNRTMVKFVVGREGCSLHPADRVDQYGCQAWNPSIMQDMTKDMEAFTTEESIKKGPQVSQLSIQVMHPVILKRIGMLASVSLSENPVVISAFRNFEEEALVSAQFSIKDPGIVHHGYRYQQVEPLVLQKGTHLEMALNSQSDDDVTTSTVVTSSPDSFDAFAHTVHQRPGPGVLIVQGMREDGTIVKGHNSSISSILSFMYAVQDVQGLQRHVDQRAQRQAEWSAQVQAETEALEAEAERHGDILLVKGVDVYRSLPWKLLQCHEWFWRKHVTHHVMKTDDDSYVDLGAVADTLSRRRLHGRQWWGNFRREWGVERVGKWREEDYAPSVYPPFACGSGSVVSRDLHGWLADNGPALHSFQGEDVSLGIWLSPLAPTLLQDSRWQCFSLCQDSMLSMPDLTPQQVKTRWHRRHHCPTPCSDC